MERKEEIVNKKVWILEEKNSIWKPNKKTWIVKDYIDWGDERLNGDYCPHLILEDSEGNTKNVREYECVFIPNETLPEIDMVNKFLADNLCYPDEVYHCGKKVCVSLEWSDWKHGHIWCETLMKYLGYEQFGEIVTEENGSDCYSSVHYFYKNVA